MVPAAAKSGFPAAASGLPSGFAATPAVPRGTLRFVYRFDDVRRGFPGEGVSGWDFKFDDVVDAHIRRERDSWDCREPPLVTYRQDALRDIPLGPHTLSFTLWLSSCATGRVTRQCRRTDTVVLAEPFKQVELLLTAARCTPSPGFIPPWALRKLGRVP